MSGLLTVEPKRRGSGHVDGDRTTSGSGGDRHETRIDTSRGSGSGVGGHLGTRVSKGRLGDGMIFRVEREDEAVPDSGLNVVGIEDEAGGSVGKGADRDGDGGCSGRDGQRGQGDQSGGEVHDGGYR
jgi:hypothetical protein